MRISYAVITALTLFSAVSALPGKKLGTNSKPASEKPPPPPANPGDIVLFQAQDAQNEKVNGHGSSKRKVHPGIVVHHEDGIAHIAPIGHEHPGNPPPATIPSAQYGIPATKQGPGLISLGPPKQVPSDKLVALKEAPRGGGLAMPPSISPEHLHDLKVNIVAANQHPTGSEKGEKDKGKKKREIFRREEKFRRRRLVERAQLLARLAELDLD